MLHNLGIFPEPSHLGRPKDYANSAHQEGISFPFGVLFTQS